MEDPGNEQIKWKQQKKNNSGEIIQLKDKTISTSSSGILDRNQEKYIQQNYWEKKKLLGKGKFLRRGRDRTKT